MSGSFCCIGAGDAVVTSKSEMKTGLPMVEHHSQVSLGRVRMICALFLWIIVSAPSAVAQDGARPVRETLDALIEEGGGIYRAQCSRCHGKKGEGQRLGHDAAPRLGGSFARLSTARMLPQIIAGGAYMPPFRSMSDREIAAVATFVRNSFGNDLGLVSEVDVAAAR